MAEFMRNSDAFTWAMESDPQLRSTVVTVILLDRSPDWLRVRGRFELLASGMPRFRQRVIATPPPAPPRWEEAPDFDLDYHVRRAGATGGGGLDEVLEAARIAQMEAFDLARPMWHATVIEGLADGRAAVLCKFHHALTDGIGGVQIAMTLFDASASPEDRPIQLPQQPTPEPSGVVTGYRDTLRFNAGLVGNLVASTARSAPGMLLNGVLRPRDTAKAAAGTVASVYRTVRPISRTGSPLMKDRNLIRHLSVLDVPMPRLHDAAHRYRGSLNDAFVAGVTGGLRRYHEEHGAPVGDLHITMPVNLRTDRDPMGGNRITLMRFDVPAGIADPGARIKEIHRRTARVRGERSLPYTQLIAGALNLMPRWYIGSVLRHVDFVASNVPGIPIPVFFGGAAVEMQYAFGPTIGSAVNVTLLTYVDTCALGVDVDTGAIPDPETFYQCLAAGFDEVLALSPA